MTDPLEIEAWLQDKNSGLADRIGRDIARCAVALLAVTGSREAERLHFCGSGTLVTVGNDGYILTAAHVWELFEILGAVGIGLTLDKENVDHKFVMDVKLIVPFGPDNPKEWNEWGPDLRLLRIPTECCNELKRVKGFYQLGIDPPALPNVDAGRGWILIGSPEAQGTFTPQHADLTMNAFFAIFRSRQTRENYDYVDFDMDVTFPGIPYRFNGVSGAGLWSVFIYGTTAKDVRWIATLAGVAFYQLDLEGNIRPVRCHGEQSVRSLIARIGEN